MKTCSRCKEEKPLDEFYRDRTKKDGRASYCKDCKRVVWREWYHTEAGSESVRRYKQSDKGRRVHRRANRQYGQTDQGKEVQRRADIKPSRLLSRQQYRRSTRGKTANRRAQKQHRQRYPGRIRARRMIAKAIASGKIPSASLLICCDCGKEAEEYHHPYYDKPLDVIALCRQCHRMRHT